jgi:hypothetical protein
MMADTVIYLIGSIAAEMAVERAAIVAAGAAGAATAAPPPPLPLDARWLPPPLVEGNFAEDIAPTCHFGEDLHHVVISSEGWSYLADDEKPGFQTNVTGAVLELAAGVVDKSITLSYLRSWLPGMGAALLTCVAGCTCEAQTIDARGKGGGTVMVQHNFGVTAAGNCTLRVVAQAQPPLAGDAANGTRFKVMGITTGVKTQQPHSGGLGGEARAVLCVHACRRVCFR